MKTRGRTAQNAIQSPLPLRRAAARKASSKAAKKEQSDDDESFDATEAAQATASLSAPSDSEDGDVIEERPTKRRRTGSKPTTTTSKASTTNKSSVTRELCSRLFTTPIHSSEADPQEADKTLSRQLPHSITYHRPPLLSNSPPGRSARNALLTWFDSVSTTRSMPWRKPWINPTSHSHSPSELRSILERRAYEVWISEIMLQQTRVAVVIGYWNSWMAKWPTIHELAAAAAPDDVLSAWRGLGYYSRATRIHEGAKLVCRDPAMKGLLPSGVAELEAKVPGVGRYTAGAISAIVFGHAAPMVDGNVLRVLSRQLGILGDVKADKRVVDVLWAAADELVKKVARDGAEDDNEVGAEPPPVSDRPGRWGQALMELGSTVCTPKPNCSPCPISSTCRAYAEGYALALGTSPVVNNPKPPKLQDIEDICTLCEPFEEAPEEEEDDVPSTKRQPKPKQKPDNKQQTLSSFFFFTPTTTTTTTTTTTPTRSSSTKSTNNQPPLPSTLTPQQLETISNHAKRFPLKKPKKKVREEESLVCAIRRSSDGHYLIHRRPDKGLLAGMWEFPSLTLPNTNDSIAKARKTSAVAFVSGSVEGGGKMSRLRHVGEIGSVPWLFSHLRLTMHVHLFELDDDGDDGDDGGDGVRERWAGEEDVERESMGTGMRRCWGLVRERGVGA
ncbi:DNA glycosylase [Bombardia bombarda]|uniref:Adenine DNA glycosylase n=1 Tax=Bombardia bombarda TaxID=252184 RepID=A0AA39U1M0_9PEZI|nr:DNA glycosylase [Bombardia bombarda]